MVEVLEMTNGVAGVALFKEAARSKLDLCLDGFQYSFICVGGSL